MIKLKDDIQTLTEFKRDTTKAIRRLKRNKRPMILTVNGKAELIVQDAESYQDILDRLETIEGVRRGLADMKAGRTTPASEVHARIRKEFGIPE